MAFIVPGCAAFVDMLILLIVADVVIRRNARNKSAVSLAKSNEVRVVE